MDHNRAKVQSLTSLPDVLGKGPLLAVPAYLPKLCRKPGKYGACHYHHIVNPFEAELKYAVEI